MKNYMVLTILLAIAACSTEAPPVPTAQRQLEGELGRQREAYLQAKDGDSNEYRAQEVMARSQQRYATMFPFAVVAWACRVANIDSEVTCDSGPVTYRLQLVNPERGAVLAAGSVINFSGTVVGEGSFSGMGAVENPELSVVSASIN